MASPLSLLHRCETAEQSAAVVLVYTQAVELAARHGALETDIREIHLTDAGALASIELRGVDADGLAHVILNFAL